MTPLDILNYAFFILLASIPLALAMMIIGAVLVAIRNHWKR